jgi:hypothetical protein
VTGLTLFDQSYAEFLSRRYPCTKACAYPDAPLHTAPCRLVSVYSRAGGASQLCCPKDVIKSMIEVFQPEQKQPAKSQAIAGRPPDEFCLRL